MRNRDLHKLLYTTEPESQADRRRRSSAISRKLRLLRAQGIIRKVPRTHRYQVSDIRRAILVAVVTAAPTSVNQLNQTRQSSLRENRRVTQRNKNLVMLVRQVVESGSMGLDDYKVALYRNHPDGWVAEIPAIEGCYALMSTR